MTIQETIIRNDYFRNMTTPEVAKMLNCSETTVRNYRKDIRHKVSGWYPEIGANWEDWAARQLWLNNIPCILTAYRYPYDIYTKSGLKVEVKTALKPLSAPSNSCINPAWSFKILKIAKPDIADFFMLIIAPEQLVFIIPNEKLPNLDHIRFCYPTSNPDGVMYAEYINAYHLLRGESK